VSKAKADESFADGLAAMRAMIASGDVSGARARILALRAGAAEDWARPWLDEILYELSRYAPQRASVAGDLDVLVEPLHRHPEAIFLLRVGHEQVVGRKRLSALWLDGTATSLHGPLISSSMLLGSVIEHRLSEDRVLVFYRCWSDAERRDAFAQAKSDTSCDVTFPYPMLRGRFGREVTSDPAGWVLTPQIAACLDAGEAPFRAWTLRWLARRDLGGCRIFDPGCSTGTFLAAIKAEHPRCYVIGQDLSEEMVDWARPRLDECHLGDALRTRVPAESIDYLFLRLLVTQSVDTRQAHELFDVLLARVKVGGHVVVLGYAPILLSESLFVLLGLAIEQRLARDPTTDTLFQCYVLKKTGPPRASAGELWSQVAHHTATAGAG